MSLGRVFTPYPVNWNWPGNLGLMTWFLGLDELAGTKTLYDIIAGKKNGILTNGATWATGENFSGVRLDGTNDYIAPTNTLLWGLSTGSMEFVVKWNGTQNNNSLASVRGPISWKGQSGNHHHLSLFLTGTDPATSSIRWDPYTYNTPAGSGSTAVGNGVVRHIGVSWRSGSHAGYIDGEQEFTGTTAGTVSSSGTTIFGSWNTGAASAAYAGVTIYGLRVYNRVIPAEQWATLHEQWRNNYPDSLNRVRGSWFIVSQSSGGGGPFTQSVAGSVTPSGSLSLTVTKYLSGSVTGSGVMSRTTAKPLSGSLTGTGSLAKQVGKPLSGSLTASGAMARASTKLLSGSLTPAGDLSKRADKSLAGSVAGSGALVKQAQKLLSGSVTGSGALATQSVKLKTLSGSLTATGSLAHRADKALAGSVAPAGSLAKQAGKPLAGSVAASGALTNQSVKLKALSGSLSPAGALAKVVSKPLAGSATAAGAVGRLVSKPLAGSVTATGALARSTAKPLAGSVTAAGTLANQSIKVASLSGSLAPSGALSRVTGKALAGSAAPTGAVSRVAAKGLSGSVAPSGALSRAASRFVSLAGSLVASGALAVRAFGLTPVIVVTFALRAYLSALFRLRSSRPAVVFAAPAVREVLFKLRSSSRKIEFSVPAVREVLFSGGRMTPSDARIKVGNVGIALVVQFLDGAGAVIDISAATLIQINLLKPPVAGVSALLTKTGVLYTDGTDGKARYSTVDGDLDVSGYWSIEGYVEVGGSEVTTDPETFYVFETIGNGGP